MNTRFILAILLLMLAFGVQFFLAGSGIFINIIFATLIAFSFFFDLWELIIFILVSVFVINWQPAISWEILLFAVMPVAAYGIRNLAPWNAWAMNLIAIFFGTFVFYGAIAPRLIVVAPWSFAMDIIGSMIFGQIVFSILNHYYATQ